MSENDLVSASDIMRNYTAKGTLTGYKIELAHSGLNEHRVLQDRDQHILANKAQVQLDKWSEKWAAKQAREEAQQMRAAGIKSAEEATRDARDALTECDNILKHTLLIDDRVEWAKLKSSAEYSEAPGGTPGIAYDSETGKPLDVVPPDTPVEPREDSPEFAPKQNLLTLLVPSLRRRRTEAAQARFAEALDAWREASAVAEAREQEMRRTFDAELSGWADRDSQHRSDQQSTNELVDELVSRYYTAGRDDPEAVEEHAELVLNASRYPDWINVEFDLIYSPAAGTLVVDYELPDPSRLPSLSEVTYVASRDEFREKRLPDRQSEELFDRVCYQIVLRTLHELFEADETQAFDAVVFNGWVEALNPSTGNQERSCIISVQAPRAEFELINLAGVDPKACFRSLKGVSAARLAGLSAIPPVVTINRDDRRFVENRAVTAELGGDSNLATMPWEDFEHLVREVFEQEFAANGGEVRVTQASRDGGVDAVVFDPDPLRGGKIVIQAKRYTNTVGVAAIRDLYGTVMNEGANKGILVTTADYGPDAYAFAREKPLTLLNGSNLLAMLESHGHRVRIDLREARERRGN